MSDKCERNVLLKHWKHWKATAGLRELWLLFLHTGKIHASKPATRGCKAEAINFYGYCLTNANAVIVFPLQNIFGPKALEESR